jgi:hypothetical protein
MMAFLAHLSVSITACCVLMALAAFAAAYLGAL